MPEANQIIVKLQKDIGKKFDTDKIVKELKKVREYALEEEDPRVTKVLRLAYEHIEKEGSFQIAIAVDEDEEGNEIIQEPGEDHENLNHLLELILHSDNKYNREEMRQFVDALKEKSMA